MARLPEPFDARLAVRWSVRRRLEFIDFRLFWHGSLQRRDLIEKFGISKPQASADIAAYLEHAPNNCEYDRNAKQYVVREGFVPLIPRQAEPQSFLTELRSMGYGLSTERESWIGVAPSFSSVPLSPREVDAEVLRSVLHAIDRAEALLVLFQSDFRPRPEWRWITPHALGYDGRRWHARSFCHRTGTFDDFAMGRVLAISRKTSQKVDPKLDREWVEEVELELELHPDLPKERAAAAAIDFQLTNGRRSISVLGALVSHVARWLGFDLHLDTPETELNLVVLSNRESVNATLDALRAESAARIQEAGIARLEATDLALQSIMEPTESRSSE